MSFEPVIFRLEGGRIHSPFLANQSLFYHSYPHCIETQLGVCDTLDRDTLIPADFLKMKVGTFLQNQVFNQHK